MGREWWESIGVIMWAMTGKRTLWGGGALQTCDICLEEDGGERGGALGFDSVAFDTASKRRGGVGMVRA